MTRRLWRVVVPAHEVTGWPRPDRPPNRYPVARLEGVFPGHDAWYAVDLAVSAAHVRSGTPRLRSMMQQSRALAMASRWEGREDRVRAP